MCIKWQIKSILIFSWISTSLRNTSNDLKISTKSFGKYQMSPGYRHTHSSEIHSQIHPNISEQNNQTPNKISKYRTDIQSNNKLPSLLRNSTFWTTCQASTATLLIVYKTPLTFYAFISSFTWNATLYSLDKLLFIFKTQPALWNCLRLQLSSPR